MDLKSIKNKLTELNSSNKSSTKEKIDYSKVLWKPKAEGKYQIRIVPSKLDSKNPFQEVFIHYGISKFPIYALTNWGEKDPIVEFAKKLRSTSDKENWVLAKKVDPKMRVFAPIIVRGEEEKGVRLWEFGKEIYMELLGIADDEDYGDYTDIEEGRDFTVELVTGDIGGRQGLKSSIRIKPKQSQLSDNSKTIKVWLDEQPDILSVQRKYSFDDLKSILETFLTPEESDDKLPAPETTKEDVKVTKSSSKTTSSPSPKKNAEKFDALFEKEEEEEEQTDDLPF